MSAEIIDLNARRGYQDSQPSFYNSAHHAQVHEFHPRIARCSICLSPHHRASQCRLRPRDILKTD